MGAGAVTLHAGAVSTRIALKPGPPRRITLEPGEPLGAGSDRPARVVVQLADAEGSPVSGARLTATLASGRVSAIRELGGGRYAVEVIPPRDPGRGSAVLHVEVAAVPPGLARRVTLHPGRSDGTPDQLSAEAWVDDDLGLPMPDVPVALTAPDGASERVVTDRYGTARISFTRPRARSFAARAEVPGLPGLAAALDFVVVGGITRSVCSVSGQGALEERPAPSFPAVDLPLPLRPAAAVDLKLTLDPPQVRAGQPVRVRVQLGGASASNLLYQASGGTLELTHANGNGTAELRFVPPPDARPGTRFLLSVTDAHTRVTAFTEVVTQ
jgi:hypothetical protein